MQGGHIFVHGSRYNGLLHETCSSILPFVLVFNKCAVTLQHDDRTPQCDTHHNHRTARATHTPRHKASQEQSVCSLRNVMGLEEWRQNVQEISSKTDEEVLEQDSSISCKMSCTTSISPVLFTFCVACFRWFAP